MDNSPIDKIIENSNPQNNDSFGNIDPEFLNDFILDAKEHIEKIEMNVLLLETEPENKEVIHSLFREFHTIKGSAGFVDQYLIQKIAHNTETILDRCRTGIEIVNKSIIDLILDSVDLIKKLCDNPYLNCDSIFLKDVENHINNSSKRTGDPISVAGSDYESKRRIGEILVEEGIITPEDVKEILEKQQTDCSGLMFGQITVKEKKAGASEIVRSLRKQECDAKKAAIDNGYIRIPIHKVDNLVDMMGELIIIQSLVEQEMIKRFGTDDRLISNLLKMSRITKDIQNLSMSLRMVSLKSTFQKINRIGRDTIAELGKNAGIELSGEETEIDRGVAEKLLDPLIHLVKNCIAHGIEPENERIEKGKPAKGLISIDAYNKRGNVYIEISDDGKGIDVNKVYKKAVEKNLIRQSENFAEDEVLKLIFLPGFSTSESVDNVSGRGVGLDVVKTEISKIGGRVDIINRPGRGCTFILKIPINLAIMNGTIVDIMGEHFIIPTLNIKKIFKPEEKQWIFVRGRRSMVRERDDLVPVIPLNSIFKFKGDDENESSGLIVIIELDQKQKALAVNGIVGKQEIVVKSLGYEFSNLNIISGASILGDGRVALILDVENLFRMEGEK